MRLTGIITQGASRMGAAEYIKAFKVASSLDGISYITYKADGIRRDKVKCDFILRTIGYFIIFFSMLSPFCPSVCFWAAGFCGERR